MDQLLRQKNSKSFSLCLLSLSLFLLPCKQLWAQNQLQPTTDQLSKQLETAKLDTNKVYVLDKLANLYKLNDRRKARLYADQEMELSLQLNWIKGQVMAYYSLGWLCSFDDKEQGFDFYQKGYELAQKNGLVSLQYRMLLRRASAYNGLGKNDDAIRDYKSAVEYYLRFKEMDADNVDPRWFDPAMFVMLNYSVNNKIAEGESFCHQILTRFLKEKDSLNIRAAYRLMGMHFRFNDMDKAIQYFLEGLKYFRHDDTSYVHARSLTDVAPIHTRMKNYVKALECYQAAIAINPKGNFDVKLSANGGMRNIYKTLGDYNKALSIDLLQVRDYLEVGYNSLLASRYYNVAEDYLWLKEYNQALLYLNKALHLNNTRKSSYDESRLLGLLSQVYYRMQRYDEALNIVQKNLDERDFDVDFKNKNELYLGMIIRDAPDEVLQKYNIPIPERYQRVIKNLEPAIDYFKKNKVFDYLQEGYKQLSVTYEMMNDYKGFHDTYKHYTALRDSAVNRDNQNAFLSKVAELQFEKREDSLTYQQRLIEGKLQQQTLLSTQQQQALLLNQQKFALLGKEKDLQALNYLKTQSDLQAEQSRRRANEKQLSLSQKEQALAQTTMQLQKTELKGKQAQSRYLLAGIAALLILSFFIARNYYNQRKSNRLLTAANTQITQANQEITAANQQINTEKQRSDNLLLNILPADVAEELKEKGSAGARLFDHVTVLFTDFVNFTTISELLTPQELVDELHHCFKAFDEIIGSYDIEKIKTIGDAYLAVAGLPNADAKHAHNVVQAALEIRQFIHDRKERMGNRSFDIRIGIHSGSVVAGIVGVKKFAYDIWGDTVNTAARMEQHSQPGQINLSEKTYELVKGKFAFTYRGEIEAKNKGALKMYFVEKQSAPVAVND